VDLAARIDTQLRERLEEAVDFACLDALVAHRRARGLPPLEADSARDRAEYEASVRAFLAHLEATVAADLTPVQAARLEATGREAPDEPARLIAVQVTLARELPDYWQRFEAGRASFSVESALASGGQRRGLLRRLFRRG